MAASKPTSWLSVQPHILFHLTYFGTLAGGLGCFPFDYGSYHSQSDCRLYLGHSEFDLRLVIRDGPPSPNQCSTSKRLNIDASPKAISGRTSYLRVRLEFLRYPQVIQALFNVPWFGPPVSFTSPSTCSWVGHLVSGLRHDTNTPY